MLTPAGPGAISPLTPSKIYYNSPERETAVHTTQGRNYDSLTLSSASGENRSFLEMVSRLSQEVRTSTTTGDIQALRGQLASGQYVPDAMNIAARMLMLGEEQ